MKYLTPIAALGLALALSACGSSGDSGAPGKASTETKRDAASLTKPKVEVPKGPPPPRLVTKDLRRGSGATAKDGDEVIVQYVGVEYKSGKQIDASWDRGEPFTFVLGAGSVIPGWDKGVVGMKVEGRREMVIPSKLAYGSGALVFVVDLVGINGSNGTTQFRLEPVVRVPEKPPPSHLVIEDLQKGSGAAVRAGDKIVVNYVGVSYRTGKEFEATWNTGKPTSFQLGAGKVVAGWERGLRGMKVGGRRELIIPSNLAFKRGAVIYVIDLLDVE